MALVDDIEFYGRAVAAGEMTRADAVRALVRDSGRGLTERGAADSIANWQTVRARYEQTFRDAAKALDRIYGLDDIDD